MPEGGSLRFVPSRVEGLPEVTEGRGLPQPIRIALGGELAGVSVRRDRSLASSRLPVRQFALLGWQPRWLPVGQRDWFHPPSERFFRFYTRPCIVIFMPDEAIDTAYGSTLFRRIQDVMLEGGFSTYDMG